MSARRRSSAANLCATVCGGVEGSAAAGAERENEVMKFDLINTQRTQGARWQVHAHGCKDVLKFKDPWTVDAESPEEVIRRELDMGEGQYRQDGWTEKDFKVMPCTRK